MLYSCIILCVQRTKRIACCYEVRALSIYIYGLKILNMQMSLYTQRCICKLRERVVYVHLSISACYYNYLTNNDFYMITFFRLTRVSFIFVALQRNLFVNFVKIFYCYVVRLLYPVIANFNIYFKHTVHFNAIKFHWTQAMKLYS